MYLGLKTFKEVATYAIIFGQSQARNMTGEEVRNHIAEWLDVTPHYALRIINRLIDQGLVTCHIEVLIGHKQLRRYRVTKKYVECLKTHFDAPPAPCAGDKSIVLNIEDEESVNDKINNNNDFIKPTMAEMIGYCAERGNGLDGEYIWNYYEAKGWMVGKSPMKDWRAAVRTWENSSKRRRPSIRQQKANNEIDQA